MTFKKKGKFAVSIDERSFQKLYLEKLIDIIEDKYDFLKENNNAFARRIERAKFRDVIVFGSSRKYDYTVMSYNEFIQSSSNNVTLFNLSQSFNKVLERLENYADKNYYQDDEEESYCVKERVRYFDFASAEPMAVIVTKKVKPVVIVPKKKKELELQEVAVYGNHVRIGYDAFKIRKSFGEEYVVVDGNTYFIERDSYGNGKLVTI